MLAADGRQSLFVRLPLAAQFHNLWSALHSFFIGSDRLVIPARS